MSEDVIGQPWISAVLRSVGATAEHLEQLPGGAVNHTFRADRPEGGAVVLRFPADPRREDEYPVEAWAAREAARIGIPTATPLLHGVEEGVPFTVSEYVEPDPRGIARPWTWLGAYARAVGRIPLRDAPPSLYSRFGADLEHAWSAHLHYDLAALDGDDRLHRDGAYVSADEMRDLIGRLESERFDLGLAHGDLAPRNLISRGPLAPPVLIDWGAAETGPTPWTDARRVVEWAFIDESISRQEHDEFMVSAGLDSDADHRTLVSMTVLHLLDVTRWALERRPDLYGEYLARCRTGIDRIRRSQ
ncbi:phosphotransferase family protein [Curtobacterium sp. PhB115]|uniref:phosphotransferase family protein n=1 Tax=Curtobacterium sp. PhB115 TaxID=2485173 RepID=UPI000F4C2848|nr:phosphotransferase [Curtobacterium sp. PhB115]ROP65299.1 aminoglycoside phosphotransferase (APT) family kinase protein [Curtobacterium sp. PhB115]